MSTAAIPRPTIIVPFGNMFRRVAPLLRFSLRDLFLVTLVCGALIAWAHGVYEQERPLKPSHIAEYFTTELANDVIAARAQAGETGPAWSFILPPRDLNGVWQADHCLNREWWCELRLPWDKVGQFHDELIRRIGTQIRHGDVGEHVSTSEFESESKIASPNFFGDSTKYHCGDVHGTIHVYFSRTDAEHVHLIANLNEHRVP